MYSLVCWGDVCARDNLPKAFLPELFDICLARAKERWRSFSTGGSEAETEGVCGSNTSGFFWLAIQVVNMHIIM